MATPPRKRVRNRPANGIKLADSKEIKTIAKAMSELEIEYRGIDEPIDYQFNPRDNKDAIEVVRQSIRQFGFINPLILDEDDTIIVGHTRRAAGKLEGITRIPTIKAVHLTPKQIQAFRIVDNKVGEIATWNYELLAREMKALGDTSDMDMTDFGFKQEQVDCLSDMVDDACLASASYCETSESASHVNAPETAETSAPKTTRFVIGEFVIHIPAEDYQAWARDIREENEFSPEQINADILRRLGVETNDA